MSTLKSLLNQSKVIKETEGACSGETVIVLGCSPYLIEYDNKLLIEILKRNKSIAIKQALLLFPDLIDIHIYNCCNFQKYLYPKDKPLSIECSTLGPSSNDFDLYFHIKERDSSKSLSATLEREKSYNEINKWELSNHQNFIYHPTYDCNIDIRPCGPGILSEIVFYFCAHLKFSRIILIGCDNQTKNNITHFYRDDKNQSKTIKNDPHSGVPSINLKKEKNLFLNSMLYWDNWFKSKGVSLEVVSKFNNYPPSIKKTNINEILS